MSKKNRDLVVGLFGQSATPSRSGLMGDAPLLPSLGIFGSAAIDFDLTCALPEPPAPTTASSLAARLNETAPVCHVDTHAAPSIFHPKPVLAELSQCKLAASRVFHVEQRKDTRHSARRNLISQKPNEVNS